MAVTQRGKAILGAGYALRISEPKNHALRTHTPQKETANVRKGQKKAKSGNIPRQGNDLEQLIKQAKLDLTLAVSSAISLELSDAAKTVQAKLLEVTAVSAIRDNGAAHWRLTRAYTIRRAVAIGRLAEVLAKANEHAAIEMADLCDAADMIITWARQNDGCDKPSRQMIRINCSGYSGKASIGCKEN